MSSLKHLFIALVAASMLTPTYPFTPMKGTHFSFSNQRMEIPKQNIRHINCSFMTSGLRPPSATRTHKLSLSSEENADFSQITSALALIDSQWQQQQKSNQKKSAWQKVAIPKDIDETISSEDGPTQSSNEFIYYLPTQKESKPDSVILFLGGAGLGQYPHITYNNLLTRLSQKSNSAILAAPYNVNLDHFELAKRSGDLLRRAVIMLEDGKLDPKLEPIEDIPKYALCHSLGAKLQLIFMAATNTHMNLKGVGLMAYNNFGLTASIQMTQSFLNNQNSENTPRNPMFNELFQFAEQAVNMIGIDFTPSPSQMDNLLTLKFNSDVQKKCRLFVFDQDDLDSSTTLIDCVSNQSNSNLNDLEISRLPGSHLSPVYLQFKLEDLEVEDEIKGVMGQFTNDFQQISWGDENELNALVEEIFAWMNGKPPSISIGDGNTARLLGVVDAEIE